MEPTLRPAVSAPASDKVSAYAWKALVRSRIVDDFAGAVAQMSLPEVG